MVRYIALDTETTGLNKIRGNGGAVAAGHRIIEVACVEIFDNRLTGRSFHSYINPEMKIDPKATKVHGIKDSFLKDKPKFKDIANDLLDFIGDSPIVIHNADFDTAFLNKEFKMLPKELQPTGEFVVIDTLKKARSLFPDQQNTLAALCKRYKIANAVHHSALLDATQLAQIFLKMTEGETL